MKYLGFENLPPALWSKSIFSRNWSKDMICNPATAYDMVNTTKDDYRFKIFYFKNLKFVLLLKQKKNH